MSEWSDQSRSWKVVIDLSNAGQWMQTVTVHGTWSTNSFSAWSSEWQCWIQILFYVNQGIQIHGRNLLQINIIAHIFGLVIGIFRIIFIDEESFHGGFFLRGEVGIMLFNIVGIQIAFYCWRNTLEEDICLWFISCEQSP